MEVEVYRDEHEIFCIVNSCSCTENDVLLNEEEIRSAALEEALNEREKDIVLYYDLVIIPRDAGGFYVEFKGFFE